MSTRATYSFNCVYTKEITFYIHSDGYPEGAACYFWDMHKNIKYKGGFAEVFVKANPMNAVITDSHELHGDTEYRYHMKNNGILIAEESEDYFKRKFKTFFSGHYGEFINKYSKYLSKCNSGYETLYSLDSAVKSLSHLGYKEPIYLTLSEIKEKVMVSYEHTLEGYDQHALDLWVAEYQRVKLIVEESN